MEGSFTHESYLSTRELIERSPKVVGRFYCGRSRNHDELLPPSVTGQLRSGEEDRRAFKDVIFLSNNIDQAIEYAGPEGVVYLVDAAAVQYKPVAGMVLNAKKLTSISDDVYICLPEDIKIVAKWHKEPGRKRGEPASYRTEYVGQQEVLHHEQRSSDLEDLTADQKGQ